LALRALRDDRSLGSIYFAGGSHSDTVDIGKLNLDDAGRQLTYRTAKRGPKATEWANAEVAELIRLVVDKKAMRPVYRRDLTPAQRAQATYYNPKPKEKLDSAGDIDYRMRGTLGGDRLTDCQSDVSARVADLDVVKIHLQSVVSDDAFFATFDIRDYYLDTPLDKPVHIRLRRCQLPPAAIASLGLSPFLDESGDGTVTFEVTSALFGHPAAGKLSEDQLLPRLAAAGYHQTAIPCLFRHESRPIQFTLIVDDFGVKYKNRADAEHLLQTLECFHQMRVDWTGRNYVGYEINHDRIARTLTLSMPGYVAKIINRFRPNGITSGAASPMLYTPPTYGSTAPQSATHDDSAPATASQLQELQAIVGSSLYYARALDYTALTATCSLSSAQSRATASVLAEAQRLLAYLAAHPDHQLVFVACDMILHIHSDASHLSRPNAKGVVGGYHFCGNLNQPFAINGAVHALSNQLSIVTGSAAETECAGLFANGQHGQWLRYVLDQMGYVQPPTIIVCDNTTAVGLANNTLKLKRSKFMDMRLHWIRDRVLQGMFDAQWHPGSLNLADFFTKAQPVHSHRAIMPFLNRTPITHTPLAPLNRRASRARSFRLSVQ
jgi:hypothetical protein